MTNRVQDMLRAMQPPIVVASHRRSGTHLTMDLIRKQFPRCSPKLRPMESPHHLYVSIDTLRPGHHNPMTEQRAAAMLTRDARPVVKTHAEPDLDEFGERAGFVRAVLDRATVIYVVRDGRKVLSSQHLYEHSFNPDSRGTIAAFIRSEFKGLPRPAYWKHHVELWRSRPVVHVLRYEDIIRDTERVITDLAGILGERAAMKQPLLPKRTPSGIAHRVNRLLGRTESTTVTGRPRPGVEPRPWQESFSNDDRRFFDQHAGDLLIELGYEPDHAWSEETGG